MAEDTYGQLLRAAAERLTAAGVASPEWDARVMAAHLIHTGHMDIPLADAPMPGFAVAYDALVSRREQREPLQYVLGTAWFGPLELSVGPGVFIPRPETEVLADWAVRYLRSPECSSRRPAGSRPCVVDLCTGSGAIAAYVSHFVPQAQVYAVELSDAAMPFARANLGEGVRLVQGDATDPQLLRELDGTVDLVLSNPPYVPETPDLAPEVYHDPHQAVFAGADGMGVIDKLVPQLARLARPGAPVAVEHDDATSALVQRAFSADGRFKDIEPMADLTGRARFVRARRVQGE